MTELSLPRSSYVHAARRHRSPGAFAGALILNGGILAALVTLQVIPHGPPPIPATPTHWVKLEKDPPENKPEVRPRVPTQKPMDQPEEKPFIPDTILPPLTGQEFTGTRARPPGTDDVIATPPALPQPHVPVFRAATQDPRYADAFHPDYPPALQREGLEGSVTVRVTIDEKGRVSACELVKTTNRAFFEETREQALRHWRFRPATRDGTPVQSMQTLTVHFRLDA